MNNLQEYLNNLDCIVFCSGKCGGTCLTETIRNSVMNCIHLHDFDSHGFSENFGYIPTKDNVVDTINNLKKKIYIIDSYRLPIERKISSFFQNLCIHVPDYKSKSVEELINIFNNDYINFIEEYHSINEIMNEYNIENFKEFNFKEGYNSKEYKNIVFVKLLFKNIHNWDTILSKIFGKTITINETNINNDDLYKEFKLKYKVPKTYIDNILKNDEEFKIYNSEKEQELYIEELLKKSF
jgi:hypothetical protein